MYSFWQVYVISSVHLLPGKQSVKNAIKATGSNKNNGNINITNPDNQLSLRISNTMIADKQINKLTNAKKPLVK